MKLNKREKQIFYGCIALVSLFIMERVIFKPFTDKLAELRNEISLKEAKLIKGLRAEAQRDQILKEYKGYEGYLKVKGSDEEIVSEFLREVERLARESAVSVSDVKPQSSRKRGLYNEYNIEVRTEATLKDIVTFLYRLNNSVLLLRVEKINLTLKDENSDVLKVNMVLSGMVVL